MKRIILYTIISSLLLLTACSEYQSLLKSTDTELKYDKAVEYYAAKKYEKAISLFEDIAKFYKGSERAQAIINYLAKSHIEREDYEMAREYYRQYIKSYPRGNYIQEARFMIPFCYYKESPDYRLDQTSTHEAITEFQNFINLYPESEDVKIATGYIDELNDKLARKELFNADLYYNMGIYMGNNYLAAVVTADDALKKYPTTQYREDLMIIILKSKYQQAVYSEESMKVERYQATVDEYYTYLNEFPEGKFVKQAHNIFKNSEKYLPTTK